MKILPGTGRGTRRSLGEGGPRPAPDLLHHGASRRGPPPRPGEDQ
jgi:hypothetical protein